MQLLFPWFLGALAVIGIPIIIHLFYFRRFKKIYFTNVRFLKEVKEETSNRQKLRNLLVLLMRCLAIAAMVLAFAQPFLPRQNAVKKGEKNVSIFVDNSFSMNALNAESSLLNVARTRAKEIVSAYSVEDRFQILTADFEGRHQRLVSKEDALNLIEEIKPSPASRDLSKVLARQSQCLATGKADNKVAFLLSDFQKNATDLANFKDSTVEVNLLPMRAVQEKNISIDSAWFESPVQMLNLTSTLFVKISNRTDEKATEIRLSLRHDGQNLPVGTLEIAPRSSVIDTVRFTILHPGWHEAKLSITDYPVQFDDDYYLNFQVAERINVLTINDLQQNTAIEKAFTGAKFFQLKNQSSRSLDYSKFSENQGIIMSDVNSISSGLSAELVRFAKEGGQVLIFPPTTADLNSYKSFLQNIGGEIGALEKIERQVATLNTEEFVFRDVFLNKSANLRLPNTSQNFKLAANRGEQILTYRDGAPFLAKYTNGEGAIYVCAAPLDESSSNLTKNAEIFVPMLFKIAIAGSKSGKISNTIGKDEILESPHSPNNAGREMVYKLRGMAEKQGNEQGNNEFIPEQRVIGSKVLLTPGTQVRDAGWYKLMLQKDSTLAEFAFNYDRKESALDYFSAAELGENLPKNMKILSENAEANLSQIVGEQNQGIVLWRWCVIFALLFLALEVLFLRLWKV
jgi:Aerotolerance regulator N-terminal